MFAWNKLVEISIPSALQNWLSIHSIHIFITVYWVAMPDHIVMYVQFSSGVTIWQCVLEQVVNTTNVHGNSVDKWYT